MLVQPSALASIRRQLLSAAVPWLVRSDADALDAPSENDADAASSSLPTAYSVHPNLASIWAVVETPDHVFIIMTHQPFTLTEVLLYSPAAFRVRFRRR
jgi:hypothetical protein